VTVHLQIRRRDRGVRKFANGTDTRLCVSSGMIFQKSAASYGAESWQMMKAVVVHKYGGPEELKFEEFRDPVPGAGEVLVRVAATSINPFDIMRRSGAAKNAAPIKFPGVVGVDLSGTILKVGPGVSGFAVGDQVFAMADQSYAELCVVKASSLAKIPAGLDLIEAAALPLVTTTGNQLISVGTGIQSGQTVLVTGAVGNVGRSAVFTAEDRGAVVIAGVLKRQVQEAGAWARIRLLQPTMKSRWRICQSWMRLLTR
jgi:NADPH:quinone reductase-like Zn-dependent oxidoreductase